jgi:hypothetical protein
MVFFVERNIESRNNAKKGKLSNAEVIGFLCESLRSQKVANCKNFKRQIEDGTFVGASHVHAFLLSLLPWTQYTKIQRLLYKSSAFSNNARLSFLF